VQRGSNLNVLVTGGAGFVGSHVCKTLAASGFLPICLDNLSRGHRASVRWGPLEIGDIADEQFVQSVLRQYQPAAIMHLAAYTNVGESVQQPLLYYQNNIAGTVSLLKATIDFKPVPFVFSSTCAIYGLPETLPLTEDHTQRPISPYGFSKFAVEQLLANIGVTHLLPWIALRYFNAAGSDPGLEVGEQHHPETHLIPLVLEAALRGAPVDIFGTDYETPDGTCIRDYVHVMDIAEAHVRALNYLLNGGSSCALNLANSRGHSVKEVIACAEQVCNRAIAIKPLPRRQGDAPVMVGSADRARIMLGWVPSRSSLEVQIRDAWRWRCSLNRGVVSQRHDAG
jgi:UDP-arabinose 4-epimerase